MLVRRSRTFSLTMPSPSRWQHYRTWFEQIVVCHGFKAGVDLAFLPASTWSV
jgi:hypothetical protein